MDDSGNEEVVDPCMDVYKEKYNLMEVLTK